MFHLRYLTQRAGVANVPMTEPLPSDVLRAALVLTGAAGQALMAYWPDLRRWPQTITTRSSLLDTPLVPPGWAFAVWGPIFLSCAALAIFHALPGNLTDPALRVIGWWAALLFGLNVLWEAYVPRRGLDWTSVAIIAAELAVASVLAVRSSALDLHGAAWWLVAFPLQLFAGWVAVAAFVNLSSTLRRAREDGARVPDPNERGTASTLLAAATVVAIALTVASASLVTAAASAWGIGTLAARTGGRLSRALTTAAAFVVLFSAGTSALALTPNQPRSATTPASTTDLPPHRIVRTDVLEIAYLHRGPDTPPEVVFVHGFPDDASAWLPVMDALAERGIASAAPYLRGFGPTRFADEDTPRSGQLAALVSDLSAFLDEVEAEQVTLVGHD